MQALKFTLSGETAFFKKPDVNTFYYFTFGSIHKVALLGIFGAILGYQGYNSITKKQILPEFYEKLKDSKVAILPRNNKGYIPKKIQLFNNSTGYASKEQGGNLIVKEQWLEGPIWQIVVLLDNEEANKLADALCHHRTTYIPYLGKNEHPADISDVEIIEVTKIDLVNQPISSLVRVEDFKEACDEDDEDDDDGIDVFKYQEKLPVALHPSTSLYEYATFMYTNLPASNIACAVYKCEEENIIFY